MNYNQVHNALIDTLTSKREHIAIMSQYAGGWEGWLQCELALRWQPGEVEREAELWDDGRAADLWFPSTNYCVELKCFGLNRAYKRGSSPRHLSDISSTYKAWTQDILKDAQKISELPSGSAVSIVVVPTWLPLLALSTIKAQLSETTYRWEEASGFYLGFRSNAWL